MSNALSQEFVRMTYGKREVVVDGTISGMGRGAGNTPTELIAQYMVSRLGYSYDIDSILDIIDDYMDNIKTRCSWGYSTPYFVAGCYSAHVNNIAYLTKKNTIRSKDIRYILNKIGEIPRKRYDYDLLEKTYLDYMNYDIDDSVSFNKLNKALNGKDVLVIVPGNTAVSQQDKIKKYIEKNHPVVISVNFIHESIYSDFVYMSNSRRYNYWKDKDSYKATNRIIASNLKISSDDSSEYIISFNKLIKCGWNHIDNSTLMLLRLIDMMNVESINIAGFDGYSYVEKNYASTELELSNVKDNPTELNKEIESMLKDYKETRKGKAEITFITDSRFSKVFQ